jgi:hypothetical protein
MMNTKNLVVGWRAIGQAANLNPGTLRNANSFGALPVKPSKIGTQVAMTPAQIKTLMRGAKQ